MSERESLFSALRLALAEERGLLIVALYELSPPDLEKLVEAAQLIDAEGVEILDAYDRGQKQTRRGNEVRRVHTGGYPRA